MIVEPTFNDAERLRIEGVSKSFGNHQVLDHVSLDLPAGRRMALIGPSGSGKTTVLRCVAMLEMIDAGAIYLGDRRISVDLTGRTARSARDLRSIRSKIGMVFQHFNLFPNMTAIDNVTLAPVKVLGIEKAHARDEGLQILASVGLAEKAHAYPSQLSGGQQQRVAIARALAMHPSLLLFDEVTSALDPELVGEVLEVVRKLAETSPLSMMIVTHEMRFAADISDHVVFMEAGRIVEEGTPEEVLRSSVNERTRKFLHRIQLH